MIEACGVCGQKEEAAKLFQEIKKDLEPSIYTINAYFQACEKAAEIEKEYSNKQLPTVSQEEFKKHEKLQKKLYKIINEAVIELSTKCKNMKCNRYFKEEEIIAAWPRGFDTYFITCPTCKKEFIPTLDVQLSVNKMESFYFLSPPLFKKEVKNLIENKGINVLFRVSIL